jgi:hypothetical protein
MGEPQHIQSTLISLSIFVSAGLQHTQHNRFFPFSCSFVKVYVNRKQFCLPAQWQVQESKESVRIEVLQNSTLLKYLYGHAHFLPFLFIYKEPARMKASFLADVKIEVFPKYLLHHFSFLLPEYFIKCTAGTCRLVKRKCVCVCVCVCVWRRRGGGHITFNPGSPVRHYTLTNL